MTDSPKRLPRVWVHKEVLEVYEQPDIDADEYLSLCEHRALLKEAEDLLERCRGRLDDFDESDELWCLVNAYFDKQERELE